MQARPGRPLPDEKLRSISEAYRTLPPEHVRWITRPGQVFLRMLRDDDHRPQDIADAMGVTVQAVRLMLIRSRRPLRQPAPWPKDEELQDLRAAWNGVQERQALGFPVYRDGPQFAAVHQALRALRSRYALHILAAAIGVHVRRLRRYTSAPKDSEEEIIETVRAVLPAARARRLPN